MYVYKMEWRKDTRAHTVTLHASTRGSLLRSVLRTYCSLSLRKAEVTRPLQRNQSRHFYPVTLQDVHVYLRRRLRRWCLGLDIEKRDLCLGGLWCDRGRRLYGVPCCWTWHETSPPSSSSRIQRTGRVQMAVLRLLVDFEVDSLRVMTMNYNRVKGKIRFSVIDFFLRILVFHGVMWVK